MSKYLDIKLACDSDSGKTQVYGVWSKRSGDLLGIIQWFGRWHQYALQPKENTTWNAECLNDISAFLKELMGKHYIQRKLRDAR